MIDKNSTYAQGICQYFEDKAIKLPNHPAVIFEGEEVSYQALNDKANQLAHYLINQDLGEKPLVAILMNRSLEMVVSLLAVLKAGGSYLPIDPDLPESRILYMLENSRTRVLLSHSLIQNDLSSTSIQNIIVDQLSRELSKQKNKNPSKVILPEDQVYVIYTSGSTGLPKGCMLNNAAVCNRLEWMQETFNLTEKDRVLQKTPFGFDVSVWEFFWPLMTGATLVLARPGGHKDPAYLVSLIKQQGISVCHFVPSMLNIFLQETTVNECNSLRYVMASGEALKPNTVHAFYKSLNARLINLYGPTEAAIDVTYWICDKNQHNIIPIGKPIKNVEIHILDEELNNVSMGEPGEICISGICLADGYINQKELTDKSFVIKKLNDNKGLKVYKTGDLGRFLADENIEYLGRIDDQIKLRGNRIELGEIESLLRTHSTIRDAAVISINNDDSDGYIAAFVILNNKNAHFEKELKSFIKDHLPEYMVPSKIIELSEFPLTENGKTSKKLLVNIFKNNKKGIEQDKENEKNSSEENILNTAIEILKKLLNLENINPEADLYELGATSLTMMRLAQMINNKFGIQLSAEAFLQNPTILGIIRSTAEPKQNAMLPCKLQNSNLLNNVDIPSINKTCEKDIVGEGFQNELNKIISSLLNIEKINIDDDLFEKGATSLTIMRISQELNNRFGVRIPTDALLNNPTLGGIFSFLTTNFSNLETKLTENENLQTYKVKIKEDEIKFHKPINLFSKSELDEFKNKELNLREFEATGIKLKTDSENHSYEFINARAAKRTFEKGLITFENFSKFLSLLKCETILTDKKFQYPSAGSTYAVQLYIHLKKNAVENLEEGIYYYHPKNHKLYLISSSPNIPNEIHFYYNRPIYQSSSFSLYFIAQMDAIEPIYGEHSKQFATIEAGSILQLLMSRQAEYNIGLCPVGTINFESIRSQFKLDHTHQFIQCIVGGSYFYNKNESNYLNARDNIKINEDIAIIGISGRYPGAKNLEEYWHNLKSGKSQIRSVPSERWDYNSYYNPDNGVYGKWGGFLEDIDKFDSLLFNIAPTEAHSIDPQQRLLLMQVWETLEDAGYTPQLLNKIHEKIGTYIGVMWDDYKDVARDFSINLEEFSTARHAIANRISYTFNFQGPSLTIDTSCSSAMTAIHLACESLKNGDCNAAIVGGVNLILHPNHLKFLSNINMISHDNKSCAFSEKGTGWVPGEGAGSILIKPLAKAIEDGDNIHGIIKSSCINHSGRTHQYGMPNPQAQAKLMKDTLEKEGIDTSTIDYIECASSGALLFDSAEYSALSQAYSVPQNDRHKFRIGSVKPNIGHLESAAALSQLTKVLLQLKHKKFLPTIDCEPQSPLINLESSPFIIQKRLEDWEESTSKLPRRAAINAFGGAGSYGHLIIEAYEHRYNYENAGRVIVPFSAATKKQLTLYAQSLLNFISSSTDELPPLNAIAYTFQVGRVEMEHRVAFIVESIDDLKNKLKAFLGGKIEPTLFVDNIQPGKFYKEIIYPADLEYLAENWVKGAHIDWGSFYVDTIPARVSLPTYPFSRERYWFGEHRNQSKSISNGIPIHHEEKKPFLRDRVIEYLKEIFVEIFEIPYSRVNEVVTLEDYGISSLLIQQLHAKMCVNFPELSKTVFFQCKTIGELANFLLFNNFDDASRAFGHLEGNVPHNLVKSDKSFKDKVYQPLNTSKVVGNLGQSTDIAIIGLSGRYPMSKTLDEFWSNLESGQHCVREIPQERWHYQEFMEDNDLTHGNQYCRWGGFLEGVDEFDPLFFNISPREAEKMDPQERLFLEASWEVLEDAGYSPTLLAQNKDLTKNNKVGVFVGVMWSEYPYFAIEQNPLSPFPHTAYWSIANRVSYCLNLNGPSIAVDTACSSSLTAIHMACESINSGSSSMAIAGGGNLSLHPNKYLGLCQMGFASSNGQCRSFGEGGDGYVPSEGVGAVLLKPLKEAINDGDHIYAVIKGSAINHGGRTNGYTVPDPKAHANLIVEAITRAAINPRDISYVEAHGTGTLLGDPIEIKGLSDAFAYFTKDKNFCAIGSVKSNIGHAEASAGIAGLTKVLLQYKHNKLVPTLHSENPNKEINFEQSPFYLQRELADWKSSEKHKYSSISSFGAGGSNAHIILAEAPEKHDAFEKSKPYYLVVLSAKNAEAFNHAIKNMIAWLQNTSNQHHNIESISYTLNTGREHFSHRGAWVVADKDHLLNQLNEYLEEQNISRYSIGIVDESKPKDRFINEKMMKVIENEIQSTLLSPEHYRETLTVLSMLYIQGYNPNWDILHHNEAHQKISLPTYPFTRESYWVAGEVTNKTTRLKNDSAKNDLLRQQLFYQKSWLPKILEPNAMHIKSITIYDEKTEHLARAILKQHNDFLCVNVSESYLYLDKDLSEYSGWIDLSASYLSTQQERLFSLLQRWIEVQRSSKAVAIQVTSGLESLEGNEVSLLGAEKVGIYRMLHCEYSHITSFHLDLDPAVTDVNILSNIIIQELGSSSSELDVCYRNNTRYVSTLQEIEPKQSQKIVFNESDVLLVTGGTKGIGLLLAQHFITHYGAKKLVLTGREQFPPRELWFRKEKFSESLAKKLEGIQNLEQLGAEIKVLSMPLDDKKLINNEINFILESMGQITGIIHAAGYVDNENPAFIRKPISNIEAVLLPKITGLQNLLQVIDPSKLKCMILCSSISSMIPALATGLSDYAAANAFMDYFASAYSEKTSIISIQWPSWRDTGMGEVVSKTYQDSGILSITDEEGLKFIDQIISSSFRTSIMPLIIDSSKFNLPRLIHKNMKDSSLDELKPVNKNSQNFQSNNINGLLQQIVEEELKLKKGSLDSNTPLANYGLDSILLTQIARKINKALKLELDLSHLLENNTVTKMAAWLLENELASVNQYFQDNNTEHSFIEKENKSEFPELQPSYKNEDITPIMHNIANKDVNRNEPIAVVGMACQFPGADSLEAYWHLLSHGHSAISSIPENCWGIKTNYFAGMIDRIYEFDPDFFMIAKEDAIAMDPQATLLLKESLNAIYDANYNMDEVSGTNTGVYVGARSQHQIPEKILLRARNPIMAFGQNYLSANISQFFNFYGPSIVIDTACSSALVAMNMAVEALRLGKIQQALVAGVNLLTSPSTHKLFEQRKLLQEDGIFHIFDERASGIVLGEGVGAVFLKPLSAAERDGDKIYAVISGININNDGRTAGPATPNMEAQQKVMETTLTDSGCNIDDIRYIDVNGSGSKVTDLLEIKSINAIYRKDYSAPLYLGSMKPNIGHPLCAEGIASFIKVCLMLHRQMIVPFLSGQQPLKHFSLEKKNMVLPLAAQAISLPYAAINCFADGGTNAHVILKQYKADVFHRKTLANNLLPKNFIDTRTLYSKVVGA